MRYTVMSSTHPTVISPSSRKTPWTAVSNTLFFFISSPQGKVSGGTCVPPLTFLTLTGTAPALLMTWLAASDVM